MENENKLCPVCGGAADGISGGLFDCGSCGLVFRPDPESAAAVYWTPAGREIYLAAKKKLFELGLAYLASVRPRLGVLLDIGCAEGGFLSLAARAGWNVEGIETDTLLAAAAEGAGFQVGTRPVEEAGLAEASYDAVTVYEVFSQMSAPRRAAEALFKALKPGGAVFIREFNAGFHLAVARLEEKGLFSAFRLQPSILHDFSFRPCTMRLLLERAGFRDIRIRNSPPTSGDPYRTGGKLGSFFTGAAKYSCYLAAECLYFLSFGKILAGSAMIVTGRK